MRTIRVGSLLAAAMSAYLATVGTSGAKAADAQTPAASRANAATRIDGIIVDQQNGLPVAKARVGVYRGGTKTAEGKSDASGRYAIDAVGPGYYTIEVEARGYQTSRSSEFVVASGQSVSINLVLNAERSGQTGGLRTIGSVSVSGSNAVASTTAITRTLDPSTVQKENGLRLVDQLVHLPGVNGSGLSSSVGDDTSLNIRGLGASETVALLDGHPVGPQGVYGINGGGTFPTSFNYANTPLAGLNKVQVTFGSGGAGLYGVDAIGGTVDFETISPTAKTEFNVLTGFGDQGRQESAATLTGSLGRLGFAFAGGTSGTYGLFSPGLVAQTGRPNNSGNGQANGACTAGNDISRCNLALNTYDVSGNSLVKSGLGKLTYNLSNNTRAMATVYASGQISDSTGNGDNDYVPFDTRLAQIQTNDKQNCALPGSAAGAKNGYTVITGNNGATSCYTAGQWANASYGPYGGGADRNRGTNMNDYHFRVETTDGKSTITADGFHNNYKFYKTSEAAAGYTDPSETQFAGTAYSQYINTNGYFLADNIVNENSDIGFGYFGEYELGTRLNYNVIGTNLYNYDPSETTHYDSGFARGHFTFSPLFSTDANFWVKHSSVDNTTSFDPRLSLVFHPRPNDVVRLTYGHSTGDPAAELKASGPPTFDGNPSSLNPTCTPYNGIGSGGNPGIKPERANDYEIGYAHRFDNESSVQLNLYDTVVGDQLFSAAEPILQYGAASEIPPALLLGYARKIASIGCNVNPANPASALPFISISTTYNAARAQSKGIELTGRQRVANHLYVEYGYNVQSVTQSGINEFILNNNPFIINGGQVQGIPINQGNVAADYRNHGFEVRTDGYVVGNNNPKSRPGYNTWDGFISQKLQHDFALTLGISNIFNEAIQNYGYIGHQAFIPENQFFNDTNSIQQSVNGAGGEEYGVPSRSYSFTASWHI